MPQIRRKTGRTNDPASLRAKVLDAASDLFQLKGYQGTAMSDVIDQAGVTGGAVFHHYRSKKELGISVIRERVAQAVRSTWITPVVGATSARRAIKKVILDIAASLDPQRGVKGCPVNNLAIELSLIDPDFRSEIATIFDEWQLALASKIEADLPPVRGRAKRARDLAGFVISAYSGAMALAKTQQDPAPLRAAAVHLDAILSTSMP